MIAQNNLSGFVSLLDNEIKNLGCSLGKTGAIDKKVEKKIKEDLLNRFKSKADSAIEI
jgi:hypothetical protein